MSDFTNKGIARILKQLAVLLEINGENKYKARAYRNASRRIMDLDEDISDYVSSENLQDIDGIGEGIAETIKDTFKNGFCPPLEELKSALPSGLLELLELPGLGPSSAHQLFEELKIEDIEGLRKALKAGKIRNLKGFGARREEKLLSSVENYEKYRNVILLSDAQSQAEEILIGFQSKDDLECREIKIAGSTRRWESLIEKIDFIVVTGESGQFFELIAGMEFIDKILNQTEDKITAVSESGVEINFWIVKEEHFPGALIYHTGIEEHFNKLREIAAEKDYQLNKYGLMQDSELLAIESEEEIYGKLGLPYIIPELREDRGEIEAALSGNLPDSIGLTDIRGDLHIHSRLSDGAHAIEEMVLTAREKGYEYMAVTDHSRSLKIAHGLSLAQLKAEGKLIDELQEKYGDIKILKGIEVDILSDGRLDYEDEILSELDLVIASIHTGFRQSIEQITARITRAMQNPHVDIIAHPQGRLLGRRKSYQVDLEKIIKKAAATGTCLEINASPFRLDLDDINVREAAREGVKIVINTDAHHSDELNDMKLGVSVAQRGWLEKDDVLNTMSYKQLCDYLGSG